MNKKLALSATIKVRTMSKIKLMNYALEDNQEQQRTGLSFLSLLDQSQS